MKKRIMAILLVLAMMLALLASCSSSSSSDTTSDDETAAEDEATTEVEEATEDDTDSSEATETKDTFVIGVDSEFTSLSPITTGSEGSLIVRNGIYETLFVYDDDGELIPWLAEGYEWTDDTTLVITLKEGITFHNGNAFTAEDVLYTIQLVADSPSAASRVSDILIDESYAEDDYTVVLKTSSYSAVLLGNFAGELLCMLDKDFCEEYDGEIDQVANGTGPYCLDAWNMGTNCVLVKNEDYWNSEELDAYFQYIDIRFFNDNTTAFLEYESGTLDAVYVETASAIEELVNGEVENTYYVTEGTNYVTSLFMSQNVGEEFTNLNLRMAIAHAIDVETMVTAICGNSVKVADSMFPSTMTGYVSQGIYEYDVELAQSYLDAYKEETGVDTIELTAYLASSGSNEDLAESIQAYLSTIGITMTIETGAVSDIIPLMMSGTVNFGMSSCGGGDDPADMFVAMKSTTANLLTKFADQDILDLIDAATFESDWDTRMEMYAEIQATVYEEYLFIPLYENINYYAVSDSIDGFTFGTGHGVVPATLTYVG